MKYSKLFGKTLKDTPRDEVAVNAKLLIRAGFIDKLMSGSYTLLPLGWRVVAKIEQIIREEIDATGAQEMLMPLLHPKEIWNETGRWDSARDVMYQFEKAEKEYALSFTHEEIVLDAVRKHVASYTDFPIKIYHFSTKFRAELRAKSGILRGREFLMKDLYSLHTSKKDMERYYWEVADAYLKIFKRLDLDVKVTEASGGVFTEEHTHEFQVLSDAGEDTIYTQNNWKFPNGWEMWKNKEVMADDLLKHPDTKSAKAIEVGNIFPLGTMYSEKMNALFTDKDGVRKPIWFASYGIGVTRILGAVVEVYHDDKGIIWPEAVAPFAAHLIEIQKSKFKSQNHNSKVKSFSEEVYDKLQKAGIEVLFDDRDARAGEKFADADLIGIPVRLVVSPKTGEKIEVKERKSGKVELLSFEEVLVKLGK